MISLFIHSKLNLPLSKDDSIKVISIFFHPKGESLSVREDENVFQKVEQLVNQRKAVNGLIEIMKGEIQSTLTTQVSEDTYLDEQKLFPLIFPNVLA